MKTVAFVPIKLNNERLPNKNILPLGGKPLCRHMLDTLLEVKGIDEIYVFCSDETIKQYLPDGVRFLRRKSSLDSFKTEHYQIVDSFLSIVNADIYVNAHVTNPFITVKTIEDGLSKVISGEFESAHTVFPLYDHLWYKNAPFNFTLVTLPRTQEITPMYIDTNLCIYRREVYTQNKSRYSENPYFMIVDKYESVDIDYPDDYELAKAICLMRGANAL